MERFITYFDFLGFKSFIQNNSDDYINTRMQQILGNLELSLGQEKLIKRNQESSMVYADLSNLRIGCLFISDTIIMWTNDNRIDSFEELLKVSFHFNWQENLNFFPLRGLMIFDDIYNLIGNFKNEIGGSYMVSTVYGKGLVKSYLKVKNMNWAGSVIDDSVINKIKNYKDADELLNKYTVEYNVPYKDSSEEAKKESCFRMVEGKFGNKQFEICKSRIENCFKMDKKDINSEVMEKMNNTIKFLETIKEE